MSTLIDKTIKVFRQNIFNTWHGSKNTLIPKPGLYHYLKIEGTEKSRLHLRVEDDQTGILVINASRILHLNQTAVIMAYLYLEKSSKEEAIKSIYERFEISKSQAALDFYEFCDQISELTRPDGACPIHDLDIETTSPFKSPPSAPYRMDLALTYRCNNDCSHCYNARPRNFKELETAEWLQIIDKLWDIGIPHIVFTGGEPTLRADLPELIERAQNNGQITGINTNGRRLSDPKFVQRLVDAGLDHIQITLESHDPEIHDFMVKNRGSWAQTTSGLRNVVNSNLYVMTNTTLLEDNAKYLAQTLDFLGELKVPTVGLNALIYSGHGLTVDKGLPEAELLPLLELARYKTDQYNQKLIWYTPTQYCHFDPVQLDLGVKGCTAAIYNMCIEPNGDVLPCQSYYQSLGNIMDMNWDLIWHHPLAEKLRYRQFAPAKCNQCAFFSECGGGCPLSLENKPINIKPI